MRSSLPLLLLFLHKAAAVPHVIMIVADDLGYNDLGIRNTHVTGPRTLTPTIDGLISNGVTLSSYHTFKICGPSRAASLTGRYPWGAGFYSMDEDNVRVMPVLFLRAMPFCPLPIPCASFISFSLTPYLLCLAPPPLPPLPPLLGLHDNKLHPVPSAFAGGWLAHGRAREVGRWMGPP